MKLACFNICVDRTTRAHHRQHCMDMRNEESTWHDHISLSCKPTGATFWLVLRSGYQYIHIIIFRYSYSDAAQINMFLVINKLALFNITVVLMCLWVVMRCCLCSFISSVVTWIELNEWKWIHVLKDSQSIIKNWWCTINVLS